MRKSCGRLIVWSSEVAILLLGWRGSYPFVSSALALR
jgi:hypothetical protein